MPICREKLEGAKKYIPNLRVVSDHVVRGGQPDPEGLKYLHAAGVRMVINLCGGPNLVSMFKGSAGGSSCVESPEVADEREMAKTLGLEFTSIPLDVFRHPSQQSLASFIDIVSNKDNGPVFVHCLHGRDRTGLMTALYRVVCDGWTAEKAYQEMLECGFDGDRTNLSDALFDYAQRRVTP